MPIKSYKPTTPSRRAMTQSTFNEITTSTPEKSLVKSLTKTGGRNNTGRITTRHIGGGHKRAAGFETTNLIDTKEKLIQMLEGLL